MNDKEEHKKAVASALAESAATMEANYSELTLDVVDKIALRFAVVLIEANVPSTSRSSEIMSDAYDAADAFLKEKLKRDEFEIQAEYDEDTDEESDDDDDDQDDCELVAVVKQLGVSGQVLHLVINDIPVASVGSYCPNLKYRQSELMGWSVEGLEQAARDINEGVEFQEQEEEDRPPIAFVQSDCIGHYLVVNGTTVCRAGDNCIDPHFRNGGLTSWTTVALELVAEGINKEL